MRCCPVAVAGRTLKVESSSVRSQGLQPSVYSFDSSSIPQRLLFATLCGLWVALSWWLLFGGGLEIAGRLVGRTWAPGDIVRRACLIAGFLIYYLRILFTEFVFLKRGLHWNEVLFVSTWILIIYLLLGIEGGTTTTPAGAPLYSGVVLFLIGSWMNSYAEFTRHIWKQRPENHGQLFTGSLFRYSRHPNYLGDLISFSGLCLISGAWLTTVLPLIMLAGFVFFNIPQLDSHLRDHYGAAFDAYAKRTRKLVPFVY
jgi:protein-S-isoprenylcysteine O-methyltransferase Ste14